MSTSACGEGGPNGAVRGLDDTSVPGARAKLNNVLHVRDLSEKITPRGSVVDAMAASSAMGRFRRRFWAGQRTPGPQRSPRWLRICCNHFGC